MNERDWQSRVTDYATLRGWRWAHFRPAQMRSGRWATAMSGFPGFPDLVLVRNGELIFAELKTDTGRVQKHQQEWLDVLTKCEGGVSGYVVGVYVWRPKDWETVEYVLY